MAEESGRYTADQLNELDDRINYMVFGQGFVACVVDTKPTRRRTVVNMLKKIGVENIIEADSYENTVSGLKEYPDDKVLIITDLEIGKINGIRIITGLMGSHNGLRGIILTDKSNPKLEQLGKVTKAIMIKIRPVSEDYFKEAITKEFGFQLKL